VGGAVGSTSVASADDGGNTDDGGTTDPGAPGRARSDPRAGSGAMAGAAGPAGGTAPNRTVDASSAWCGGTDFTSPPLTPSYAGAVGAQKLQIMPKNRDYQRTGEPR
jgi:hypothetical protein